MVKPSSDLTDTARSRLLVSHDAGETIFREGEPGAEMYIIEEGEVEIVKGIGPNERRLALLEEGDFFGEMALLEDLDRSAAARAITDCRLLPIDASTFDQMLRDFPEIAVRMMRKLSQRLREHDLASHRAHEIAAGHFEEVSRSRVNPEPVVSGEAESRTTTTPQTEADHAVGHLVHRPTGSEFPIPEGGESVIGRHDPVTGKTPPIDLGAVEGGRTLSRRHAKIAETEGKVILREEIGTANGTWVNGRKIDKGEEVEIRDGDRIKLGLVELLFHRGDSEEESDS
ncbi:MAG: cyclic nucleotide-binding domain-containing protein [Thermoanaerobaculia bacterium]|nr:cyclic nucleotide-binding domain-containing protein [Thermoanaerobaculia bacterium]